MKSPLIPAFLALALYYSNSIAQPSVGIGTDFPGAMLEVRATNSGILIPRVALTSAVDAATVPGPITSELLYNTATAGAGVNAVIPGFYYWNGLRWVPLTTAIDHDWYESGLATPPDNINDNLYTNGLVGIGINVPTQSLHIANTSAAIQSIRVQDLATAGNAYNPTTATVSLNNRATVFVDRTTGIMYSEDANRAYWRLDGNSGIVSAGYAGSCPNLIAASMNASGYEYIGTNDNTDFIVATNDRERMRVLRDGQIVAYAKGIGTPASSPTGCVPAYPVIDAASFYGRTNTYPLNAYSENVPAVYGSARDVSGGTAADPSGVQGVIYNYGYGTMGISTNATSGLSVGLYGEEVSLFGWGLVVAGDALCTGGGFGGFSDERMKKDIKSLTGSLDIVMQLNPKTFSFKEEYYDYGFPRNERIGFLAQEVEQVLPGLVKQKDVPAPPGAKIEGDRIKENLKGYLTMDISSLIPILTGSIQEQQAIIEELRAENNEMRKRLTALEEKLFTPPPTRE